MTIKGELKVDFEFVTAPLVRRLYMCEQVQLVCHIVLVRKIHSSAIRKAKVTNNRKKKKKKRRREEGNKSISRTCRFYREKSDEK